MNMRHSKHEGILLQEYGQNPRRCLHQKQPIFGQAEIRVLKENKPQEELLSISQIIHQKRLYTISVVGFCIITSLACLMGFFLFQRMMLPDDVSGHASRANALDNHTTQ
jgi:hypothetical protein